MATTVVSNSLAKRIYYYYYTSTNTPTSHKTKNIHGYIISLLIKYNNIYLDYNEFNKLNNFN